MPVTVQIPTALRRFTSGAASAELTAVSLNELFDQLESRFPEIGRHLRDDAGRVRSFINVYVNEEDIRFLGGAEYRFRDGDEVLLIPSIAGGAGAARNTGAEVVVPATSANLGCAFDCAAMALNRRLRARACRSEGEATEVLYRGPHADRVPRDESNLVPAAMRRLAVSRGADVRGLRVEIENEIPVGVGLGTSAAAIVAGLLLGAELFGLPAENDELLALAAELEGHPDNVSAALLGGLVISCADERTRRVLWAKAELPPLRVIVAVPDVALPTKQARAALPPSYSLADAVHNLQRAALLAAACFSGRLELQPEMFRDRLHQPYRATLVPGIAECLALEHPDLLGVFLSGAGSGVLALARRNEDQIARALLACFRGHGIGAEVLRLEPDNRGARPASHETPAQAAFPLAGSALAEGAQPW